MFSFSISHIIVEIIHNFRKCQKEFEQETLENILHFLQRKYH